MGNKPLHVFIVPDGNRRWAKERGLAASEGHKRGYEIFRSIFKGIWLLEVTHFTFWGISTDNFKNRSSEETGFILQLFEKAIDELLIAPELEKEKVKVRIVGKLEKYCDKSLEDKIAKLEKETSSYPDKNFTLLFGYNGDEELVDAVNKFRHLDPYPLTGIVTWGKIKNLLWTSFLPDVDIFIRTGFESHLSNGALMMQMANAHLYFPQIHWPDFSMEELIKTIDDFKSRQRRLGA
jgi:undecaprenyl diphosphate synthase